MSPLEPKILVAGVGNAWLRDDGFGGEVARRLEAVELPDGIAVMDAGTGGLDLAYEVMRGYDGLVILDVSRQGSEPGTLYVMDVPEEDVEAKIEDGQEINPHAMDPLTVLRFLLLPSVCLALPASAVLARFLQTSLQSVLNEDFIRVARAKGLPWRQILVRHALPNAFPGVVTVLGIQFGQLLGGAVVVEAIFAWPGLGQLILQSFVSRDYLVVQDLVLLAVTVFIVLQTLTDLAHAALDPRLRLGR